ncbi:MAG: TIGR00282 family metallophosphoesterase [Oscillospiraceae bacterium]|nr:TIGR00282 family metallophosphoesterase [Ruminococcus sp.]MCD8344595.1 TIGR00282 family metallophosphoesterase [Oscillospiraceae bacterium]
MRLLMIGDVVAQTGCDFLASKLREIKRKYEIDVTVINGENSASGNGITVHSCDFLTRIGADVITTGNHAFKRRESVQIFDSVPHLLRPANYPDEVCGKGFCTLDMGRCQIAVVNLMGVIYMDPLTNPFKTADEVLSKIETKNIFVDFHAEATAEKKALGYYLAGRVTGVFGTHTHVQTADEAILNGGTAYITDVGMTGPEESVLGVNKEIAIEKQRLNYPVRFMEADTPCFINAVMVEFDEKTGKASHIERIIER